MMLVLLMTACQSGSKEDTKQSTPTPELMGADKSEQGCIGSAGYTWSVVKNSCVRVFEVGSPFIKYDVATGITDSSTVAYVILSKDKQKVEVFFGTTDKPVVMDALLVMEGETMPVLFENNIEMIKLRSHRDTYQLLYMDTIRYLQHFDINKGMGKWMLQ